MSQFASRKLLTRIVTTAVGGCAIDEASIILIYFAVARACITRADKGTRHYRLRLELVHLQGCMAFSFLSRRAEVVSILNVDFN